MRGDLLILLSDGIVILCIARCLLQWAGLDANHPLTRFCIQATDWLVKPIRKLVPPQGKWDVACILAGLLFYYAVFILIRLTASSEGFGGRVIAVNFIFAVLAMMKAAAYVLFIGLFVRMVLSIKKPYSPVSVSLQRIFESVLRPFVFLRVGRYDFSGSVLALALWFWLGYVLPQLFRMLNLWLLQ